MGRVLNGAGWRVVREEKGAGESGSSVFSRQGKRITTRQSFQRHLESRQFFLPGPGGRANRRSDRWGPHADDGSSDVIGCAARPRLDAVTVSTPPQGDIWDGM